ncbi:MAG: hydrogenase maturation protease [Ignavibacteria bacterium]
MKFPLIILGMGNELFGDDGVGLYVAERLSSLIGSSDKICIMTTNYGGLRILDFLQGYRSAIIIDAISTGINPQGYVYRFKGTELVKTMRLVSYHDINFVTTLHLAKLMGIPVPKNIIVFGIEIVQATEFREGLSPEVLQGAEYCIEQVKKEILKFKPKKFPEALCYPKI